MCKTLLFFLLAGAVLQAADYYAAPGASGDGSQRHPWGLRAAIQNNKLIQPGDTLWLRGGVYQGPLESNLTGSAAKPIVVRQYPGERAILDGGSSADAVLTVRGGWTWYWGFEVINSSLERVLKETGSSPQNTRGTGVNIYGTNVKCINLVIHDASQGIGLWSGTGDSELYGNLIYHNGWDAPDRGHGHGIYSQNDQGSHRIADNVIFNQFGYGIHVFGSSAASLNNFVIEGNTSFNNGRLSRSSGYGMNLLLGGGRIAESPTILDNDTYYDRRGGRGENNVGYNAGCIGLNFRDNYMVGPLALRLVNCMPLSLSGNTFVGDTQGFDAALGNNHVIAGKPTSNRVKVRANLYEPGRAWVTVFNWENTNSVAVDLKGVLDPGDRYQIRDVQDYFGPPVAVGEYSGAPVKVPMNSKRIARPTGNPPVIPTHTAPEFGVFSVERTGQSNAVAAVAGSDQVIAVGTLVKLAGTVSSTAQASSLWSAADSVHSVQFASAESAETTATFGVKGEYLLRLSGRLAEGDSSRRRNSPDALALDVTRILAYEPSRPVIGPSVHVNAGGDAFRDMTGIQWSADMGFEGGHSHASAEPVPLTTSAPLYETERWSATPLLYRFNVPPGEYTVVLKFAETWFTQAGERVMDVLVDGQTALANFDILEAAGGPYRSVDRCFHTIVREQGLQIQLIPKVSNVKISGIEAVLRGQPTSADCAVSSMQP